jgi:hypothetical protein
MIPLELTIYAGLLDQAFPLVSPGVREHTSLAG